jgi:transcription initiation factor TFIIIB Brf1 subunit/transcription initiation factor TFIIB
MNCQNCGSQLKNNAKFCSSCGKSIEEVEISQSKENTVVDKKETKSRLLDQAVRIISIIIGFAMGRYLGIAIFIFIFAFLAGQWFPKWYFKRQKINYSFVKWIVWSNVLTWFLPPLGILTGFAALEFSNLVETEKKKYKTLAIIGIALSLINAISGILMNL